MQCIAPLPGEKIIMLIECLKEIMKDKKNESKVRRLGKAVCLYLVGFTVLS